MNASISVIYVIYTCSVASLVKDLYYAFLDGSAHSSGCVVNGYGCRLSYYAFLVLDSMDEL